MFKISLDTFKTRDCLLSNGQEYNIYSLSKLPNDPGRLPYCLRILLENLIRNEDGKAVSSRDIERLLNWDPQAVPEYEIAYTPARVILQDFTGVPSVVDLAVMRDAVADLGKNPSLINPLVPVDLVIDHSVQVDSFGKTGSLEENVRMEFLRNQERYNFLKWGQEAFSNFRVVPPATGIIHQVNLEYLAQVVFSREIEGELFAYPDTLVGTDSHTTMINGLGVLGWGVGGIEAEAAMLGQPISMLIPQVVGVRLTGKLRDGVTATDLVLAIVEDLRKEGVVGKLVEFFGPGVPALSLADRATLSNMSPEYGATCAIFPVDKKTLDYLELTGRDQSQVKLVEDYNKIQGLFLDSDSGEAEYSSVVNVDLSGIELAISGPRRPQDRIKLDSSAQSFANLMDSVKPGSGKSERNDELRDGSVVIAAITSCTNTSNPSVMIGAGILAKKAVEAGLQSKPWVKTSLGPGSRVVTEYLRKAGLDQCLDLLGFNNVGYGCTTCIGNSGPLPEEVSSRVREKDLLVCAVLSGNRNFEGRISPDVKANYLASPPLVIAYALAGNMDVNFDTDPLGQDREGRDVFMRDLWPNSEEIEECMATAVDRSQFKSVYSDIFKGPEEWRKIDSPSGMRFIWADSSTYIRKPTFFEGLKASPDLPGDINGARVLVMLGDSVTTDHISPAGAIPPDAPAGRYLVEHGVSPRDFNSFGSRRGNHEVMVRGTFGNIRLRNKLVPGTEGSYTRMSGEKSVISIFEAAEKYREQGIPLLVIAGTEYGSGSSRDWAAKGTSLLGVKAVIAESYERIHRSNLIGMGVLPLQFQESENAESLGLTGLEKYSITGISETLAPGAILTVQAASDSGVTEFQVLGRIDTLNEMDYYRHGGILHYVLRNALSS
jgi:aconitate hydratase A / 2-methylisocitrate dehydratase